MAELIGQTREVCVAALGSEPLREAAERLEQSGFPRSSWIGLVEHFWREASFPAALVPVIETAPPTSVARRLLLEAVLRALDGFPEERLYEGVKTLLCDEFQFIAEPAASLATWFDHGKYPLRMLSGYVLLERYPAGQLVFEPSGMPRSWIPKIRPADLPRFLMYFLREGSFSPYYFVHLGVRRGKLPILIERENDKSYYLMAKTMELRPEIRGILACSWLYYKDNHVSVSKNLRWVTEEMERNGALATHIGEAAPDTGFLTGNPKRKELYESGEWRPKQGLVIWPRKQMLEWAARRPELADA